MPVAAAAAPRQARISTTTILVRTFAIAPVSMRHGRQGYPLPAVLGTACVWWLLADEGLERCVVRTLAAGDLPVLTRFVTQLELFEPQRIGDFLRERSGFSRTRRDDFGTHRLRHDTELADRR